MGHGTYKSLILATMACFSCQSNQISPPISQKSCDIALSYTKDFETKSKSHVAVFFLPTAEDLGTMNLAFIDQFLREHPEWRKNQKAQVEIELLRKSETFRNASVVEQCPALREWWKEHSSIHNDEEIRRITHSIHPRYSKEWKPLSTGILAISVPVISNDGAFAMLNVAEITNFEGGRFEVTYSRGVDGKWHMTGKFGGID